MKRTNLMKWGLPGLAIVLSIWACYSFSTNSASKTGEGEETVAPHSDTFVKAFDNVIAGNKLTVVDFYTTWCGPCKMMDPHVKKAAKELGSSANVMQVDAEMYAEISSRYNLEGYPTLIFFKKGVVIHRALGYQSFDQIKAAIERFK